MYSRIFSIRTIVEITVAGLLIFGLSAVDNSAIADGHGDHSVQGDIIEVANQSGSFNTLSAAIEAAGLTETLKGDGPFTVFAPTDAAFAKLPEGTVETLLLPENRDQLVAVLTYHVVPGKVTSDQVVTLASAKTVNGQSVSISTQSGTVMVDNATISAVDVLASNGVIHVIDEVILPN